MWCQDAMYCARSSISGRGGRRLTRGFSLIELMIGLVIGLVTSIAVALAYSLWIKQTRTVSSGNDSQSTVVLAAYALDEDLRQAGQGFGVASSTTSGGAGCPITGRANVGGVNNDIQLDPAGSGNLRLSAIQIINGGGGAPDQIVSFYGDSDYRVSSELVLASTINTARVRNRAGLHNGDTVIFGNTGFTDCRVAEVTEQIAASDKAFSFGTANYTSFYPDDVKTGTPVFNQAGGMVGLTPTVVFDLGPRPQANQWRISTAAPNSAVNPALQKFSILPVNGAYPNPRAIEVAEGIVNLQAQFGYDANGDGRIAANEWVNADVNNAPDLGGAAVDWTRVLAVRYAILARSRSYESPPFAAQNPAWVGGNFVMTDLGGVADTNPDGPLNWRRYRYSVSESVIPLRNALWGRNQ